MIPCMGNAQSRFPAILSRVKTLSAKADVVPCCIPMLISKQSLVAMQGKLDLSTPTLQIHNGFTVTRRNLIS